VFRKSFLKIFPGSLLPYNKMTKAILNRRFRGFSISRLEAFSDGVLAIASTLLVLEIGIPEGSTHDLLRALAHEWPAYLAFVVSFATIGAAWFAHSSITEHLERADRNLARLNLLFLMLVSFLPFPTRLISEFIGSPNQERVAGTLYGVVLLSLTSLLALMLRHAVSNKLIKPASAADDINVISARFRPSLYGYALLILVGLFFPGASIAGYLLIAFYVLFPNKLLPRRLRSS
jgi:TMEM175 potassium channel family protein